MKRTALLLALIVVATAAAPAAAEEAKDPDVALGYSIGGTALSAGMVLVGVTMPEVNGEQLVTLGVLSSLVTPALGHWYAGDYLTWGMAVRLAGGAVAIAGVAQSFCWENCTGNEGGGALILAGLGVYAGGVVLDIATAPRAARKWNNAHGMQVAPTMVSTGGSPAVGLGLGGTF